MANYNNLKAGIDAVIKTNGRQEISGAALNTQLKNMITELGAGYQFMGVATPATNPGTPDEKVFYLASEAGTYTNFRGIVINEGEVCALVWNGTWAKQVTGAATAESVSQLGQEVDGLGIIFEAGAVNYLNGGLISSGKSIRTADIPISEDIEIIGSFPRTLYRGYIVKYLNGVYAGYDTISVSGTNINQLLQKDATFDSFRLRFDVIDYESDWTEQEILDSSATIYLQDSVAKKLSTLSESVEGIEGKISASPSALDNILIMQGVLQLLQRMKKTYFDDGGKGYYADLSGLSVGSTFVFSQIKFKNYTYDYISVEEGDVIILTTKGTTQGAKSYAIMDADNKVLAIQTDTVTNAIIVMPTGAKSFIANTYTEISGYSFVHIMGKTAVYDSAVEYLKSLARKEFSFFATGHVENLQNGPIPSGSTIIAVTGSNAVTDINLYDADGNNQLNLPVSSLPYTTTRNYYKCSSYISGKPSLAIVTSGIEDIGELIKDAIITKKYEIANKDNDFSFDNLFVGQLVTALHQLQRNYEVPTDGAYISTDVEYTSILSEPVSDEQMLKSFSPYLFINGEKRGAIVLFDTDGTPFIYDKDGNKRILSFI